jgi:hypothetical protein
MDIHIPVTILLRRARTPRLMPIRAITRLLRLAPSRRPVRRTTGSPRALAHSRASKSTGPTKRPAPPSPPPMFLPAISPSPPSAGLLPLTAADFPISLIPSSR